MRTSVCLNFAALVVAFSLSAQQSPPPAKVKVAQVESRLIAPVLELQGNVIARQDSKLSSELTGRLVWTAEVGDKIEKGRILAKLDARPWQLQVDMMQAEIKRLQADLNFRDSEVARFQRLVSTDHSSKARLQQELSLSESLRHQINQAKARLANAEYDLDRSEVRAPFDGVVVNRDAHLGEYLQPGDALLRFVSMGQLEVSVAIPMLTRQFLSPGQKLDSRSQQQLTQLPVRSLVQVGDPVSRMLELRLSVPDNSGWLVGQPVVVSVPRAPAKQTLAITADAIVRRSDASYVIKVSADNTAEKLALSRDPIIGQWVALGDKVKPGDKVVVRGAERLQPGQPLEILNN